MAEEKERVGIRLDVIVDIARYLDRDEGLQDIFGRPVSKSLLIIADNDDLRIEEGGKKKLTKEESTRFTDVLNKAIRVYTT